MKIFIKNLILIILCASIAGCGGISWREKKSNLAKRYGINIKLEYKDGNFVTHSILKKGFPIVYPIKALSPSHRLAALRNLEKALSRYNRKFLRKHLKKVVLCRGDLSTGHSEVVFCGTYNADSKTIVVNFRCSALTVHHEISSLLLSRIKIGKRKMRGWKNANPANFRYILKTSISPGKRLSDKEYNKALNEQGNHKLYKQGFLLGYCKTTIENDFNVYAQLFIGNPKRLSSLAKRYPRIRKKMIMVKRFYKNAGYMRPYAYIRQ